LNAFTATCKIGAYPCHFDVIALRARIAPNFDIDFR
jgi:hypothetical protein